MSQGPNHKTFKLKGRLYTLTVMQLFSADEEQFAQQLEETVAQAPRLFESIPLVLDCTALGETAMDLWPICERLRQQKVFPVALQGSHSWVKDFAKEAGLALLSGSALQDKNWSEASESVTPTPPRATEHTTQCHTMTVRSGQQLVASNGDLLILGSVSPGAELLSQGHIYVYGTLRGRALAGMSGDKHARIFCQSLEAELISIAGVYRLNESMDLISGPCQIYLDENRIVVEPICLNS
jgi:septum site-determining protein MinC